MSVRNYYQTIDKKYVGKQRTYDNFDKVQIQIPFRLAIIGPSGAGKTNCLMNLIEQMNCFTRVYLFCKNLSEPLYAFLIDKLEKAGKKLKITIVSYSTDLGDVPDVESFNMDDNTLVVLDDMITEKSLLKHKNVSELFTRGRKQHVSVAFLSQSYYDIPSLIRKNLSYVIFKKMQTKNDIRRVLSEYSLGVDEKELIKLYNYAVEGGVESWFTIDLDQADMNMKFRKCFDPIQIQQD